MLKRFLIVLAIGLGLSLELNSCSQKQEDSNSKIQLIKNEKIDTTTFQNQIEKIKILNLPMVVKDGIKENQFLENIQLHDLIKDEEGPINICGRIFPNPNFYTLLCGAAGDYLIPFLYSYGKDGQLIDRLKLEGPCGEDCGYIYSTTVIFNKDYTISKTDTTRHYKVDKNDNNIPGTDTVYVKKIKYKLNDTGKFTKIDSSKTVTYKK